MYLHSEFLKRIHITQRQAVLAVLALYFLGTILLIGLELISPASNAAFLLSGGVSAAILFGGAWALYYKRNWEPIRYFAAFLSSLLVGAFLPEPFVSIYAPMVILIPSVLALLLTEPLGVIVNSLLTLAILLVRAGGNGVYAAPTTLILYAMMVGGLALSRLIAETSLNRLKQAEKRLHESERRYRLATRATNDVIWEWKAGTHELIWTENAPVVFGYSAEEIGPNETWWDEHIHPEDRERVTSKLNALMAEGDSIWMEDYRFLLKDGSYAHISDRGYIERDEHGKAIRIIGAMSDITKRKQAEQAYADSQRYFQTLIEHAPDGIALLGINGKLQQVTRSTEWILGFTLEEAKEQDPAQLTHPDDLPALLMLLNDLIQNPGKVARAEYRFMHKDGSWRYLESTISNMLHEPSLQAIVFNYRDISRRKQVEEALRRSQETYQQLFENNPHPMWVYDVETLAFLMVNDAAVEYYGYSREEFLSMTIKDIRLKEHTSDLLDHIASEHQPLQKSTGWRHVKKDGTWIDVEVTSHAIQFEGRSARLVSANDVTERKLAEEVLRNSEQRFRALIENGLDYISLLNAEGKLLWESPARTRMLGYEFNEFLEKGIFDLIHPDDLDGIQREFTGLLRQPQSQRCGIFRLRHANGTWRWVEAVATNLLHNPSVAAIVLNYHDITERKQQEQELKSLNSELEERVAERTAEFHRLNAELEHANRAKDEFLANMSHELRTPLNSILGLSESLLEQRRGQLNDYQQKSLQIVESSGRHLLELINDVLDLSKIEAGKFDFYPQMTSIDDVCRASLTFIKAQAAKRSISVSYVNYSTTAKFMADSRRLKQILVNLLTNAVKFTPERGQVALQVKTDLDRELIQFSVLDTGVGIDRANLGKLFQPFVQVDSSLNRQYEGTGLGLALVRKLTDLHGGSVSVESEVGKGSCFTVNLPCRLEEIKKPEPDLRLTETRQTEGIQPAASASTARGLILLAEDNMPNVLTIAEYLESHAYEVLVAHDGLEAITKAEETHPDLILMDIQMPVMNGLEAIAHLRANPDFGLTPIIALTALAMPGDRERCLQVGASEYLSKPVSLKLLKNSIESMLRKTTSQ
ncbi:MAG TPA: PAS domain S-box protein [Anaerolineales bacterium]|nr:PAS domain S-box protein [Anaerolineales bacterium]